MKKHTILLLAANPSETDPRTLDREAHAIQSELERTRWRHRFELVTRWAAEPLDLLRELRKLAPTVVQFSGGGAQSARDTGQPSLPLNSNVVAPPTVPDAIRHNGVFFQGRDGRAKLVSAEALRDVFGAAGASVKLVLLSTCYSESAANALIEHVDCVVGMAGSISDDAARAFAIGFYGGLGDRTSVDAAYRGGCAAIGLDGYPEGDCPRLKIRPGVNAGELVLAALVPAKPDAALAPPPAAVPSAAGTAGGRPPGDALVGNRSLDNGDEGLTMHLENYHTSRKDAARQRQRLIATSIILVAAAATSAAIIANQRSLAPARVLPPEGGSAITSGPIGRFQDAEPTRDVPARAPLVVDLTVWRAGVALAPHATLHIGDQIAFQVTASDSAYLFLVQRKPGDLSVLFPSDQIPLSNPIARSVSVRIPTGKVFVVKDDGVYGSMSVDVIASRDPLPDLQNVLASVAVQHGEVLRRSQVAANNKLAELSGAGSAGLIPRGDLVLLDGEIRRTVSVRYTQRPGDRVVIAEFPFELPR